MSKGLVATVIIAISMLAVALLSVKAWRSTALEAQELARRYALYTEYFRERARSCEGGPYLMNPRLEGEPL